MVSMRYDDKVVPDFEQLVKLLPPAPLRPRCVQRCPWLTFGGRQSLASLSLARLSESPYSRRPTVTNMDSQDIQDGFVRVSYPVHPVHPCE